MFKNNTRISLLLKSMIKKVYIFFLFIHIPFRETDLLIELYLNFLFQFEIFFRMKFIY